MRRALNLTVVRRIQRGCSLPTEKHTRTGPTPSRPDANHGRGTTTAQTNQVRRLYVRGCLHACTPQYVHHTSVFILGRGRRPTGQRRPTPTWWKEQSRRCDKGRAMLNKLLGSATHTTRPYKQPNTEGGVGSQLASPVAASAHKQQTTNAPSLPPNHQHPDRLGANHETLS